MVHLKEKMKTLLATQVEPVQPVFMPQIELPDDLHGHIKKRAAAKGCSESEIIAELLNLPSARIKAHPLVAYTSSAEFRVKASDADRYLAILGWVAKNNSSDLSDFILHQESGRVYLGMSPEEIRETCSHNQARQIPDTHYWAIMNLDTPTKRRFLKRLLVFIGLTDDVIEHVCGTLGSRG
jgi:negative regulator of replication initiation